MDRLIARFDAEPDNDLMLCRHRGVAWQRDMAHRVEYDEAYFNKCRGYENQEIARKINAGRRALVDKHIGPHTAALDIGVGSGEFIKTRSNTFGFDVNRHAIKWLKREGKYSDNIGAFRAFTFWDVIEHVEDCEPYFRAMPMESFLFASVPIFADLKCIRDSRHYRPGEHLYYWTEQGFIDWMALHRFGLLERQDYETKAGRDSIVSFAFRKSLPGYSETLAQYQKMHGSFYGSSAHLYFDTIAKQVLALNPGSILDFGCGRSDLVAHFWADGRRRIAKHDAAIGMYQEMPEGQFDLVLCTDVMEHILLQDIDRVLGEIRKKSMRVLFTISLRPARAKLPDGRNAHVSLLSVDEWTRWIMSVFGKAERLPTQWDHILMVRTW